MLQVSLTDRSDQLSPQAGVSIRPTNLPAPTAYPPDAVSRRLPHTRTVPRLLLLLLAPLSSPHPVSAVIAATDLPPPPPQHTVLLPWPPHLLFPHNTQNICHLLHETLPCFRATTLASRTYTTQLTHDTSTPNLSYAHMHASRAVGGWARETLNRIKTIKGVPFYDRFAPLFRVPLGLGP